MPIVYMKTLWDVQAGREGRMLGKNKSSGNCALRKNKEKSDHT